MSHLVIDYLKYILYYRGQFPLPLDQLKIIRKNESKPAEQSSNLSYADNHGIFCDEASHTVPLVSILFKFDGHIVVIIIITRLPQLFKTLKLNIIPYLLIN